MAKFSDEIFSRASSFIKKHRMLEKGDGVVLAVSGGSDSVAMFHMFLKWKEEWKLKLVVAHINHCLRGDESDLDEEFVKKLSEGWNIPVETKKIDVNKLKVIFNLSTEEAARKVRYEFIEEVMERYRFQKMAFAHHADDQVESILLSIIRGTGPKGIKGIPLMRDGKIIRPLMELRKWEILEYLKENGIPYKEDRTNRDLSYKRNWIRHELIPLIKRWNPSIEDALLRLSSIVRMDDDYLSMLTEEAYNKALICEKEGSTCLDIDAINHIHNAILTRIIRYSIGRINHQAPRGISYSHVYSIIELIKRGNTGSEIHLPNGISVKRSYNYITFKMGKEREPIKFCYPVKIPGEIKIPEISLMLQFRVFDIEGQLDFEKDRKVAYMDADQIPDEIYIRSVIDGDRFKPLGLGGTKKIRDFFIDQKIPREKRENIPVLAGTKEILWVIGWRIDERFKVTPLTRRVIRAQIVESQ